MGMSTWNSGRRGCTSLLDFHLDIKRQWNNMIHHTPAAPSTVTIHEPHMLTLHGARMEISACMHYKKKLICVILILFFFLHLPKQQVPPKLQKALIHTTPFPSPIPNSSPIPIPSQSIQLKCAKPHTTKQNAPAARNSSNAESTRPPAPKCWPQAH